MILYTQRDIQYNLIFMALKTIIINKAPSINYGTKDYRSKQQTKLQKLVIEAILG